MQVALNWKALSVQAFGNLESAGIEKAAEDKMIEQVVVED